MKLLNLICLTRFLKTKYLIYYLEKQQSLMNFLMRNLFLLIRFLNNHSKTDILILIF